MKTLALLLLALPLASHACDWKVTRDRTNPMTDKRECTILSPSARIGFSVQGDLVIIAAASKSYLPDLTVRVDDNAPIYLAGRDEGAAVKQVLQQIQSGHRIRTSYRDYPSDREGEAEVCNLPQLIASCQH